MSAYRIFINNIRVATAVSLKDGKILQTYPQEDKFECLSDWMWWQLDHKHTNVKGFIMEYPDGTKKQFFPEKYKLFSEGRCVSAGYRTEEMFVQRFPFPSLYPSHHILVQERIPHFGVSSYLDVKVKEPLVLKQGISKEQRLAARLAKEEARRLRKEQEADEERARRKRMRAFMYPRRLEYLQRAREAKKAKKEQYANDPYNPENPYLKSSVRNLYKQWAEAGFKPVSNGDGSYTINRL